jgi:hypothetical protein
MMCEQRTENPAGQSTTAPPRSGTTQMRLDQHHEMNATTTTHTLAMPTSPRRAMHHRLGLCRQWTEPPPTSGQPRQPTRTAIVAVLMALLSATVTPAAHADTTTALKDAVTGARGGAACPPLRSDPLVDQIADIVNKSTDDYLNQTATRVPIVDVQEGLKQLGYPGTKAYLLQGADKTEVLTIKGALLEGFAAIPDCSYHDFGVSVRHNNATGFNLAAVVLAGP